MPHGYCFLWDPLVLWLNVVADGLIALSYYCIPVVLVYFIRKNRDIPLHRVFWMFGAFILACGTTHLMEIWNVWHASYLAAGVIKGATAAFSLATVGIIIPLAPKVMTLPSQIQLQEANRELEREIGERKRAEEATQQMLKELADQKFALDQHAIVATTDVQGTITYANDKFCAISQYSRQELLGQNHRILNSGHHPTEFFQEMYRTIANGKVWRGEICNRAKDGTIYWVDATIVPFMGEDGKPRQYMAVRTDITQRKKAEEVREHLAAVVESSDDAILSKDLKGTITAWNRGAEKIFGYSAAEAMGQPMLMLFPPDRLSDEADILARVGRGESVEHFEAVRLRKDGKKIDVSVTISPIRDSSGAIVGASKIARDITERKQAEAVLASQAEELRRSNAELEQFAYVASHDLQEPLRMVASYAELLAERYQGKLDDRADKYIGYAVDGAKRMQILIHDLLAYARVSSQAKPLQPTDSSAVLAQVMKQLRATIEVSKAEVKYGQLPVVNADEVQLGQIFQNLISNAVKFHVEGPPHVEIRAESDGRMWNFAVADDGIGISKESGGRIFQMFQRLHTREEYEGSGIGLAISKRIVERHGGRIWFDSIPGKGTTFHFTIPKHGGGQ